MFSQLITPTSLIALSCFYFFAKSFPVHKKKKITKSEVLLFIIIVCLILLSFTPLNVTQIIAEEDISYKFGALYPLYVFATAMLSFLGLKTLIKRYLDSKGRYKIQTRTVLIGLLLTIIPAMLTGVVLPVFGFTHLWNITHLSAISLLIFSAIAIFKHRVFDIRLITLRVLVYGFTLVPFVITTLWLTSALSSIFISSEAERTWVHIVFVAFWIPLFPYLKKFFDKLTQRIFYRQFYDAEIVLNKLSSLLVNSESVEEVIGAGLKSIKDSINPKFISVYVFESDKQILKFHQGQNREISESELKYLKNFSNTTITNRLIPGPTFGFLRNREIDVVVPMKYSAHKLGFILLGQKFNGTIYTDRDSKLLENIGRNLTIALNDALKFKRINKFNLTLSRSVQRATKRLTAANKNLKSLNQTKNLFIATASHQLRPKITTAEGFLDLVKNSHDYKKLGGSSKENLDFAIRSVRQMEHIVFGVLETATKSQPEVVINKKPIILASLVKTEVEFANHNLGKKRVKMIIDENSEKIKINIDKEKTCEAIYNLIQNAIDYSPKTLQVKVFLRKNGDNLVFSVEDKGIGLNPPEADQVFDRFFRTSEAKKIKPAGTGIGLHVVRHFIEAQGGKVSAVPNKNVGSTFGFSLPINQEAEQ